MTQHPGRHINALLSVLSCRVWAQVSLRDAMRGGATDDDLAAIIGAAVSTCVLCVCVCVCEAFVYRMYVHTHIPNLWHRVVGSAVR